jgi:hypothetical protein
MAASYPVVWHCPNRDCNWSFLARETSRDDPAPRCVCGSSLKRGGLRPAFRYLEFLRAAGAAEALRHEKD